MAAWLPDVKFHNDEEHVPSMTDPAPRETSDSDYDSDSTSNIEEPDDNSQVDHHGALVRGTSAYEWLKSSVRTTSLLWRPHGNTSAEFRDVIGHQLGSQSKISIREKPELLTACFEVDWDPDAFFVSQRYDKGPAATLEGVVTLTGSLGSAQALPLARYVHLVWPYSADLILDCMKRLLNTQSPATAHGE